MRRSFSESDSPCFNLIRFLSKHFIAYLSTKFALSSHNHNEILPHLHFKVQKFVDALQQALNFTITKANILQPKLVFQHKFNDTITEIYL